MTKVDNYDKQTIFIVGQENPVEMNMEWVNLLPVAWLDTSKMGPPRPWSNFLGIIMIFIYFLLQIHVKETRANKSTSVTKAKCF